MPIFGGLLPFDPAKVPTDLIAGATLGALAIPETMGYANMAGMPPVTGLYTIVIPIFLFAIFGSSRHLVVGADSATAVVLYAGLAGIGLTASSSEWIAMAGLAALMVAVVLVAARVLKLGFIANFLSRSVLIGFLTGVGIQVAMGQLHGVLNVSDGSGTTLEKFATTLDNFWKSIQAGTMIQDSLPTILVAVAVWVIILGSDQINKKIPGALIAVVGMIVISYLGLLPASVTTLGSRRRRPPADRPAAGRHHHHEHRGPAADGLLLLHHHPRPERRDLARLRGQVRRQLQRERGPDRPRARQRGRRPVRHVRGQRQPDQDRDGRRRGRQEPDRPGDRRADRRRRPALPDRCPGLHAQRGPRGGRPADRPATHRHRRDAGHRQRPQRRVRRGGADGGDRRRRRHRAGHHPGHRPVDHRAPVARLPAVRHDHRRQRRGSRSTRPRSRRGKVIQAAPGLVIYRFGAGLYYANATRFTEEVLQILDEADPKIEWFCLSGASIGDIDYSGAGAIRQVASEIKKRGATFVVCELEPGVADIPAKYGLQPEIGGIYPFIEDVIAAYKARSTTA